MAILGEKYDEKRPCPFRGFFLVGRALFDLGDNTCALRNKPCQMDLQEGSNFRECEERRKIKLEDFADKQIFPNELFPEGAESWEGVKFDEWSKYVLNGQPIQIPYQKGPVDRAVAWIRNRALYTR